MNQTQGGSVIGFTGILTIVFVVFKLTEIIDWAWVWVLTPMWLPWAVIVGAFLIIGFLALIFTLIAGIAGLFKR